jgi:hypothetical protein
MSLTDDVDWAAEAAGTAGPWYGVRHGRDAVAAFFVEFGSTMEVEEFTPVSIAANDTDVLTVVRFRARSLACGVAAPGGAGVDVLAGGRGVVEAEGVGDDGGGDLEDELAQRGYLCVL